MLKLLCSVGAVKYLFIERHAAYQSKSKETFGKFREKVDDLNGLGKSDRLELSLDVIVPEKK